MSRDSQFHCPVRLNQQQPGAEGTLFGISQQPQRSREPSGGPSACRAPDRGGGGQGLAYGKSHLPVVRERFKSSTNNFRQGATRRNLIFEASKSQLPGSCRKLQWEWEPRNKEGEERGEDF